MKKKWFRAMDMVDEQYILEASPGERVIPLRKKRVVVSVLASCACLALLLCNLWLFLPFDHTPPSAQAYAGSEYFPVIKQLSMLTWEKPKYANNFQKYAAQLPNLFGAMSKGDFVTNGAVPEDARPMAPGAAAPDAVTPDGGIYEGLIDGVTDDATGGTYEEITDNQVEGITEADRIKRSDKYIYYLDGNTLRAFSIAGLDSRELGHFTLQESTNRAYVQTWEFYLSADCKTATVITRYPNENKQLCVGVTSLDVTDPANITQKNRLEITGNYLSSRITEGKLLLLTEFVVNKKTMNFDNRSTFLPQINGKSIPADQIVLPEEANSSRYTVVMKLDENTLETEGTAAFLSYSEDVYVSKDHIFLTHVYADVKQESGNSVRNAMTQITCLSYRDGFTQKGSATVRGYVKDQWSMDEYEGVLRVVTTTNATTIHNRYSNETVSADVLVTATGNSNASLYCIDLQTFEVIASVVDFAPPREEVQSVRFDKQTAYVCTSIEMSDPVFFFDLSDLQNITYKDTGTIEGFSTSLVNFGDGYLLGIGQAGWSEFKVEIYRETQDGVEGFCQYTLKNARYATEYKSYYIDRENQLLGLGIYQIDDGEEPSRYILLQFNGYELVELLNVALEGDNALKRGVFIDKFMYLFGENAFRVEKVF